VRTVQYIYDAEVCIRVADPRLIHVQYNFAHFPLFDVTEVGLQFEGERLNLGEKMREMICSLANSSNHLQFHQNKANHFCILNIQL
jgi:hypothetical protein